MKVSVSYGERTYGNSAHSKASEIRVYGSEKNVSIKINFKVPQPGRSWDWLSAGSVGGAELQLSMADARALAHALLDFSSALETHDPFKESMYARLRIRDGFKAKQKIVIDPYRVVD